MSSPFSVKFYVIFLFEFALSLFCSHTAPASRIVNILWSLVLKMLFSRRCISSLVSERVLFSNKVLSLREDDTSSHCSSFHHSLWFTDLLIRTKARKASSSRDSYWLFLSFRKRRRMSSRMQPKNASCDVLLLCSCRESNFVACIRTVPAKLGDTDCNCRKHLSCTSQGTWKGKLMKWCNTRQAIVCLSIEGNQMNQWHDILRNRTSTADSMGSQVNKWHVIWSSHI